MNMKSFAVAAALVLGAAFAAPAVADPINGTITLDGVGKNFRPSGGASLATYTGIEFSNAAGNYIGTTGEASVQAATGDVTPFVGSIGVIKNFTYMLPDASAVSFAGLTDFFTVTVGPSTLSLDIVSLSTFGTYANGWSPLPSSNGFVALSGTGTLRVTGYDDTAVVWTLSGTKTGVAFSWSSTAAVVPEPATLALVGAGLAGLGALRRRKAA